MKKKQKMTKIGKLVLTDNKSPTQLARAAKRHVAREMKRLSRERHAARRPQSQATARLTRKERQSHGLPYSVLPAMPAKALR